MVINDALENVIEGLCQMESINDAEPIQVAMKEILVRLYAHYPDQALLGLRGVGKGTGDHSMVFPIMDHSTHKEFGFNFNERWILYFRRLLYFFDRIYGSHYFEGEKNHVELAAENIWRQRDKILGWKAQGGELNRSAVELAVNLIFEWVFFYEYFKIRFQMGEYTDADGICWRYENYNLHSLIQPAVSGPKVEDYWIHGKKSFTYFMWRCDVEYLEHHPDELCELKRANQLKLMPWHLRPKKISQKVLKPQNQEFLVNIWIERKQSLGKIRK